MRLIKRLRKLYRLFFLVSECMGVRNPNRLGAARYKELAILASRLKHALEPARLGDLVPDDGEIREDLYAKASAFVANADCEPPGLDVACRRLSSSFSYGNLHFLSKFSMEKLRTFEPHEFGSATVPHGSRESICTYFDIYYPFIYFMRTGHVLRGSVREFQDFRRELEEGVIRAVKSKPGVEQAREPSLLQEAYEKAVMELQETALTPDRGYLYQASLYTWMIKVVTNLFWREVRRHGGGYEPRPADSGGEPASPLAGMTAPPVPCLGDDEILLAVDAECFQLVLPTFNNPRLVKAAWTGMILEKCGCGHCSDDWLTRHSGEVYGLTPGASNLSQTKRRLKQRFGAVVRNRVRRALGEPAVRSLQELMLEAHALTTMDAQAVLPFLQVAALERAAQKDTTLAWVALWLMLHKGMAPERARERTMKTLRLSAALNAIPREEKAWETRTQTIIDLHRRDHVTIRAMETWLSKARARVDLFGKVVNMAFVALPFWYLWTVCGMPHEEALARLDLRGLV